MSVQDKYWERETPMIVNSGFLRLQWYKEAQRLQVSRVWPTKEGTTRLGSTVTLALEDMVTHPDFVETILEFMTAVQAAQE